MQTQTQLQMLLPFAWSGISASDELGLLPPPLAGEGWGGGKRAQMHLFACPLDLVARPLPIPPPQAGEGTHRARGDADAGIAVVIAGLDPAIHPLRKEVLTKRMDPRVKPAGDP
jgi:hypothetical protein